MSSSAKLRTQAEDVLRMTRRDVSALPKNDVQRLVYELQVHQIEIEMQNDSLRSAQRDLEQSYEQYQELFDCAPAAYLLLDATRRIVRANMSAVMLIGESQLAGVPLASFFDSDDVLALHEHLRNAQWNSRALCELRLRARHGEHTFVRIDTSVMPSSAADCLVVLTDISERKRSLDALERLNRELEARVAARTVELEARNHQLESEIIARTHSETQRKALEVKLSEVSRLESLGTLAAGIAHDFNNLLVSVLGNSDLMLLASDLPARFREPLSQIQRAGKRAADLTRQMLTFAGRSRPMFSRVSLPLLVVDGLESVRSRISDDIQLQARLGSEVPAIDADRIQLHQVVMNLVNNAIEAVDPKGVVTVEVNHERLSASELAEFHHPGVSSGDFVVLRVQDSGPGIPAEIGSRIFDPFFTTKFAGRGLGLATVFGVVLSHRGAIRVRSPATGGTTFEVAFPVAAKQARHDSEAPRLLPTSAWSTAGSVLLIDDDSAVRSVVAQLLTALGYAVTAAESGEAGLELFAAANPPFDLAVVDWQMPGLTGGEVLKLLRAQKAELPVILISGYITQELPPVDPRVVRLQKPMTLAQLREAVQALVEDTSPRARDQFN